MQKTIKSPVAWSGYGVHSGKPAFLKVLPAPENHGIVFKRVDLKANNTIDALYDKVVDTTMCTVLENAFGAKIATIEHLMSAIYAMGITNLMVEVSGEEIPILDGSSQEYIDGFEAAGLEIQASPVNVLKILKKVRYEEDGKFIEIMPSDGFSIDFKIDFQDAVIGTQEQHYFVSELTFSKQIAKARTFGFKKEVEYLKSRGLALGASLDNAIAIDEGQVLNPEGLRYEDEFVRHKILDCIGDLALCGYRIEGAVKACKAGHKLNNKLLHQIFSDPTSFRVEQSFANGNICIIGSQEHLSVLN